MHAMRPSYTAAVLTEQVTVTRHIYLYYRELSGVRLFYKSQLSDTNRASLCVRANILQIKVDVQCEKLEMVHWWIYDFLEGVTLGTRASEH